MNTKTETNSTETKKAAKVENYTAEHVAIMLQEYIGDNRTPETVQKLATMFNRSSRSIIAKLSNLQVYVKTSGYKRKDGSDVSHKSDLSDKIGAILGLSEPDVSSLEKANRSALAKILGRLSDLEAFKLAAMKPEEEAREGDVINA
jgi:hypothetical protein